MTCHGQEDAVMGSERGGYWALLRDNRPFRRLWYGQLASQLGDWFDTIALYTLLLRLGGSGADLGLLLVCQALPSALVGPWAGVLIDRLSRRSVLLVADLGRAVLVLLFLTVRQPEQLWLVYAVSFAKFTLSAFFEPAREAVVPDVVPREQLVTANSISGLTWSTMLAGGAALGGLVVAGLGTDLAFVLDSVSFFLSAAFTWAVRVRESHLGGPPRGHALGELREALAYLLARRDVALYTLCKSLWSVGGGAVLVLLPLFGREVFPLGEEGALSMGLLYMARGIGASLGPVLAHRVGGSSVRALRRWLGPGFLLMAAGYLLFGWASVLPLALCAVAVAHFGGSTQWVFSTALVQLSVPGRLQGRVFAVELTLYTLVFCISSYVTGRAAAAGWRPPSLAIVAALLFVVPGLGLTLLLWPAPNEQR
jgi:MFS family permease